MAREIQNIGQQLEERGYIFAGKAIKFAGKALNRVHLIPESLNVTDLETLRNRYRGVEHTSQFVTQTWQELWRNWGILINKSITVEDCPFATAEIKEAEEARDMIIYVPKSLSKPENLPSLSRISVPLADNLRGNRSSSKLKFLPYGRLSGRFLKEHVKNIEQSGWMRVEASKTPPLTNITTGDLKLKIDESGRQPQTLNTYIIACNFSLLMDREPFDNAIKYSKLLGTRINYLPVIVTNLAGRDFEISRDVNPLRTDNNLGARTALLYTPKAA